MQSLRTSQKSKKKKLENYYLCSRICINKYGHETRKLEASHHSEKFFAFHGVRGSMVAVWRSGGASVSINEVNLRRARLVLDG